MPKQPSGLTTKNVKRMLAGDPNWQDTSPEAEVNWNSLQSGGGPVNEVIQQPEVTPTPAVKKPVEDMGKTGVSTPKPKTGG